MYLTDFSLISIFVTTSVFFVAKLSLSSFIRVSRCLISSSNLVFDFVTEASCPRAFIAPSAATSTSDLKLSITFKTLSKFAPFERLTAAIRLSISGHSLNEIPKYSSSLTFFA